VLSIETKGEQAATPSYRMVTPTHSPHRSRDEVQPLCGMAFPGAIRGRVRNIRGHVGILVRAGEIHEAVTEDLSLVIGSLRFVIRVFYEFP